MLLCIVVTDVMLSFAATSRKLSFGLVTEQNVSLHLSSFCMCHLPHHLTTEGSSAVIGRAQCNLLFAPRSCGFALPGNSGVVFPDVWIMELAAYLKKSPNVVSFDGTDDAQEIKIKSCNVKLKYCKPFVLQ